MSYEAELSGLRINMLKELFLIFSGVLISMNDV